MDISPEQKRFAQMIRDPKTASDVTNAVRAAVFRRVIDCMYHEPEDPDSTLGFIDAKAVWMVYGHEWPAPSMTMLAQRPAGEEDGVAYWKEHAHRLEDEYIQSLVDDKTVITWDDAQKLPLIELKAKDPEQPTFFPTLTCGEERILKTRKYGWRQFIPPFKEFMIQVNRRAYFHIKLYEVTNDGFTVSVDNYIGRKKTFMKFRGIKLKFSFMEMPSGQTSMNFDIIECEPHEYIVSKNINKMDWNEKDKTLYCDLIQIRPPEEMTYITIEEHTASAIISEFDSRSHDVVCEGHLGNKGDIKAVENYFPGIKVTIGYDKLKAKYENAVAKHTVPDYFQIMQAIHQDLYNYLDEGNPIKLDENGIINFETELFKVKSKIAPNLRTLHKEVI